MEKKISPELAVVLNQLHSEGIEVCTYTYTSDSNPFITSLYWFENGRMLNIQPSSYRNEKYNPDCYHIGVSYVPSREHGTGCGLNDDRWGESAQNILSFRTLPTWVKGITNYSNIEQFVKLQQVLKFYKIEKE